MLLPALGNMGVPSRVRLSLALAISVALTPVVAPLYPAHIPASADGTGTNGRAGSHLRCSRRRDGEHHHERAVRSRAISSPHRRDWPMRRPSIPPWACKAPSLAIFLAARHGDGLRHQPASSGHWCDRGQLPHVATRRHISQRRPGRAGDPLHSGAFLLGLQLAAPFLVFGFAVDGLHRPARAADAAASGVLRRDADQHLGGFSHHDAADGSMMTLFLNFYAQQMAALL